MKLERVFLVKLPLDSRALTPKVMFIRYVILLLLFFMLPLVATKGSVVSENEVKAAFVYKISHFIRWKVNSPNFCFFSSKKSVQQDDNDSTFLSLKKLIKTKKNINARSITSLSEIKECQALFIPIEFEHSLPEILSESKERNVMTISDIKSFTRRGGIFGFIREKGQTKVEINNENAKGNDVDINARLLQMIRVVE